MSKYYFEAINSAGDSTNGCIEAESIAAASRALESKGLHLITIRLDDAQEKDKLEAEASRRQEFKSRIDNSLHRRQQWLPAFKALCNDLPRGGAKQACQQLLRTLESPLTVDGLLGHPHAPAILPLLHAEGKNTFEAKQLIEWLSVVQFVQNQRRRKFQVLLYPAVLLGMALFVTLLLAIFVVPIFKEIFIEFGLVLPAPTRWVIFMSDTVTSREGSLNLVAGALLISLLSGGIWLWRKLALTNRLFQGFVSGTTSNLYAMSALCGTLGELLRFGAPVQDALGIAGSHCQHRYFELSARRLGRDLSSGMQISESNACRQLPPLLIHALELNAQHRSGAELLKQLHTAYRERAMARLDWLMAALPAITIIVLGLVVGFVTVSLFLPLFSLITALA